MFAIETTNKEKIYQMLRRKPRFNWELAKVSLRYGEYIRQLRADGYLISLQRFPGKKSIKYHLEEA